jgi:signal peptidase I
MQANRKINGKRVILMLAMLVVVVGLVRGNVGAFFVVKGSSMSPTFSSDDVVLTSPAHAKAQRGDVVIVADNRGDRVIKRIVGLPGEKLSIFRGFVYVNDRRLNEPYLPRKTYTFNSDPFDERAVNWQLNEHQYFVLGDNRAESCDSRYYGPVERDRISSIVEQATNAARPLVSTITISENRKSTRAANQNQPRFHGKS